MPDFAPELLHSLSQTEQADRTIRFLKQLPLTGNEGIQLGQAVPWCPGAYWFRRSHETEGAGGPNRPSDAGGPIRPSDAGGPNRPALKPLHHDPAYQAGAWHVQEASGLVLDEVLRQLKAKGYKFTKLLDACAAPGGKSLTLLRHLDSEPGQGNEATEGGLMAAEPQQDRLELLAQTLARTGSDRYTVVKAEAQQWSVTEPLFEGILADMPCSGEGMFRKNPESIRDWSPEKTASCAALQDLALEGLVHALLPGGWLIYATCTFGLEENTRRLLPWLHRKTLRACDLSLPQEWGFVHASRIDPMWPSEACAYWALPSRVAGEGFFFAVLYKPEPVEAVLPKMPHPWQVPAGIKVHAQGPGFHKDGRPNHALALALGAASHGKWENILREKGFTYRVVETDRQIATWFCQGQALQLGACTDGWNLLCYGGFGLGWLFRQGRQVQNFYPSSFRIPR